jgi:hypothetical protein
VGNPYPIKVNAAARAGWHDDNGHNCVVEVPQGMQHCKHTVFQHVAGAHCVWKAYVAKHPFAMRWSSTEIGQWMHGTGMETINPHTGKDMFKSMLASCKRYAASAALVSNSHINKGFTGHLISMCVEFSLKNQYKTLGEQFTPHTPYLVPGSLSSEVDSNSAGGLCLMFSTFNLALNYIRAAHWFKGNVTLAFDHTFKMDIKNRPHFTVNVMVCSLPHVCACSPASC